MVVLGRGVNVKNIPELIALAKAKPGTLNYGSAGVGSSSHLAGALFASKAGIDVVHVPFRIGADSRTALINGTIQYYVYPLPAIVGMIKAGTLRALAVGSPKRAEALPDVPTLEELGFTGIDINGFIALLAPAKLPPEIGEKLNASVNAVIADPNVEQRLRTLGYEPYRGSFADASGFLRRQIDTWGNLIRATGITFE